MSAYTSAGAPAEVEQPFAVFQLETGDIIVSCGGGDMFRCFGSDLKQLMWSQGLPLPLASGMPSVAYTFAGLLANGQLLAYDSQRFHPWSCVSIDTAVGTVTQVPVHFNSRHPAGSLAVAVPGSSSSSSNSGGNASGGGASSSSRNNGSSSSGISSTGNGARGHGSGAGSSSGSGSNGLTSTTVHYLTRTCMELIEADMTPVGPAPPAQGAAVQAAGGPPLPWDGPHMPRVELRALPRWRALGLPDPAVFDLDPVPHQERHGRPAYGRLEDELMLEDIEINYEAMQQQPIPRLRLLDALAEQVPQALDPYWRGFELGAPAAAPPPPVILRRIPDINAPAPAAAAAAGAANAGRWHAPALLAEQQRSVPTSGIRLFDAAYEQEVGRGRPRGMRSACCHGIAAHVDGGGGGGGGKRHVYITDSHEHCIHRVNLDNKTVMRYAGKGAASQAWPASLLRDPGQLLALKDGRLLVVCAPVSGATALLLMVLPGGELTLLCDLTAIYRDRRATDAGSAGSVLQLPPLLAVTPDGHLLVPCPHLNEVHRLNVPGLTPTPTLQSHLWAYQQAGRLCDLNITVGDQRFSVHRLVLMARSDFFTAMLSGSFAESGADSIDLPDTTQSAFALLLEYLYTDHPSVLVSQPESCQDVLLLAQRCLLPAAVEHIEGHLASQLTPAAAADTLLWADTHNAPKLREATVRYMRANKKIIKKDHAKSLASLMAAPELLVELLQACIDGP